MEGKTVVVNVLIMSMVLAQIQVEAKICCPNFPERLYYDSCINGGGSEEWCILTSDCKDVSSGECPPGFTDDILKTSGDAMNEYCKLGCVSSVCGAFNTLQNSDASEIVNGAVGQCAKACSTFCTKGSKTTLKTA